MKEQAATDEVQCKGSIDNSQTDNLARAVLDIVKAVAVDPPIAKIYSSNYSFSSFHLFLSIQSNKPIRDYLSLLKFGSQSSSEHKSFTFIPDWSSNF